jgi:hypothetical protein
MPSPKKVAKLFCTYWLVFQLYITIWSLTVCTTQSALVAMSPSGGKQQL